MTGMAYIFSDGTEMVKMVPVFSLEMNVTCPFKYFSVSTLML